MINTWTKTEEEVIWFTKNQLTRHAGGRRAPTISKQPADEQRPCTGFIYTKRKDSYILPKPKFYIRNLTLIYETTKYRYFRMFYHIKIEILSKNVS